MQYKFSYRIYQREFKQPLKTNHGIWHIREGIIIKLENQFSQIAFGEIAPLPWFGSETMEKAEDFCQEIKYFITDETITKISNNLPCCQFAFSAALSEFSEHSSSPEKNIKYCYLLPNADNALKINFEQLNYKTFKWKIGINPVIEEIKLLEKLIKILPKKAQLRLDANGGLNLKQAKEWLNFSDNLSLSSETKNVIEFIEQPLPPEQWQEMLKLSHQHQTALALDESVANLQQLQYCYHNGWKGVFVLKVGIMGSIFKLRDFLLQNQQQLDVVFSSVLETEIGMKSALKIAKEFSQRDVGFGVSHWFKEDNKHWLDKLW